MPYDHNSARLALGCMMIQPSLCLSDKYPIDKQDFSQSQFHLRLFQAINALARKGCGTVTAMDCYNLCKNNAEVKNLFDTNDLTGFVDAVKQLAVLDNYELYWQGIRKASLLTAYQKAGMDISRFEHEPEKYSIDEIVAYYDAQISSVNKRFYVNVNREEYVAGSDFRKTKEQWKESPDYGPSFQSPYLNSIMRGQMGLILRAGKSGGGKTVSSIGDICKICCTEYWDFDKQAFVKNKSRIGPCLFINTEMDMRKEIDPLIIAWISGVSRSKIRDGYYQGDEEARVDYADKVLAESKLYIVDDPLFTAKSLMTTIKEYVNLKCVKAACFDYIQNNGVVASEIASESRIAQREDMVLLALTDRLKQAQRICGIPILTGVQTNGQEDNMKYPTEACLAGAKAQVRKTDGTVIMLPPKQEELDLFDMAKSNSAMNIPADAICNNITHIIKGRNSRFPKHIKIFQTLSYGTGRSRDWFVTDRDGNQVADLRGLLIECDGRKNI